MRTADASELQFQSEAWDAALCIGASFVWGTIADAAAALLPSVRAGGFLAIGEAFWREQAGRATIRIIAASEEDVGRKV